MAYDKKLHYSAGMLISFAAGSLFTPAWGLAAATVAGLLKEAYDCFDYGRPDPWDAVATIAGGLAGYIVMEVIK